MFCTDIVNPTFFIFSSETPQLLYYSHLPAMFASVLFGLFVYSKNQALPSKLLLVIISLFNAWLLVDLVNWTNTDSRMITFAWSIMNLLAVLVAAFLLYFTYVFLEGKDSPLWTKLLGGGLLLPMILALPTEWNIEGFDLAACEAVQGNLVISYFHFLQITFLLWLVVYFVYRYRGIERKQERNKTLLIGAGALFFLASYSGGTFIGWITGQWELEQYGLFGIFAFLGVLIMMIVRYRSFDTKMLATQVLVISLLILIGSQFFFTSDLVSLILVGITLLFASFFGFILVRSVTNEIKRREELQEMASHLALANEELRRLDNAKSEFISIASHQLRTPLTAIKGFLSLILEGSYGRLAPNLEDVIRKVNTANNHLVELVENLLNISRLESGRMQYVFQMTDIQKILQDIADTFSIIARERGLAFSTILPESPIPPFLMDEQKIRETVSNLVDNAMKYTKEGSVEVRLERQGPIVRVVVTDTGIGVASSDLDKLFQKFRRGVGSGKVNVSGTGLGLYVGRKFAEAHGGRLYAESDGVGRGSRFILELPFRTEEGMTGEHVGGE